LYTPFIPKAWKQSSVGEIARGAAGGQNVLEEKLKIRNAQTSEH
jgi:hypothetical protein